VTSEKGAATGPQQRGRAHTLGARLGWLLLVSLLLHTLLTPIAGWLGVFSLWFDQEDQIAPPPEEQLDSIPIDLFEEQLPDKAPDALPAEDPVGLIEQWVPDMAPVPPEEPKPKAAKPEVPNEKPEEPSDAGAAEPSAAIPSALPSAPPAPTTDAPPPEPTAPAPSASASAPEPDRTSPVSEVSKGIANPVALSGEAGEFVKSNAKLGLILYTDRIRAHPVGKRIAELLPNLPQWNDFFAGTQLNPIRDFDRFFLAGPSFYYTHEVVVALQYNTPAAPIRAAIDRLVKRRGQWLPDTPVPAALAEADRAQRMFILPSPHLVLIVPPRLQQQALAAKFKGIPDPSGPEALVASMKEPKEALARLGLQVPETTRDVLLRITPLEEGRILLELTAQEETPELAKRTAQSVTQTVNSFLELVSGASSLLSQFGFGGLKGGVSFPKIQLEAHGKEIRGRQILNQEHVDFILDRVERQLVQRRLAAERQGKEKPGAAQPGGRKLRSDGLPKSVPNNKP
jgi:hypothetical protein